jgi:hypothetical protein
VKIVVYGERYVERDKKMASLAPESMASSKVEVKPPMRQKLIAVLFFASSLSGCFVFSSGIAEIRARIGHRAKNYL